MTDQFVIDGLKLVDRHLGIAAHHCELALGELQDNDQLGALPVGDLRDQIDDVKNRAALLLLLTLGD